MRQETFSKFSNAEQPLLLKLAKNVWSACKQQKNNDRFKVEYLQGAIIQILNKLMEINKDIFQKSSTFSLHYSKVLIVPRQP